MMKSSEIPKISCVYKLINTVNGKIYIGIAKNLRARMANHKSARSKYPIHSAIRKYGWDKFELSILEQVAEPNELQERETIWIKLLRSTDPVVGYNLIEVSITSYGHLISEATKRKIGEKAAERLSKKENNPFFGKRHTAETIEKIKISKQISGCYVKISRAKKGVKRNIETIRKRSDTIKQNNTYGKYKKPVIQFSKDGKLIREFESIKDASRITEIPSPDISNVIRGRFKSAGGYIWKLKT